MARPRAQVSDAERRRIFTLWEQGVSAAAIARDVGVAAATLKRVLREAGITVIWRRWARHGAEHHFWKGGRVKDQGGYMAVHVPAESPFACMGARRHKNSNASAVYVPEHRLLMAQKMGRPLLSSETVHHINGKRDDNRIENLELRVGKHGKGVVMMCADCGSRNIVSSAIAN